MNTTDSQPQPSATAADTHLGNLASILDALHRAGAAEPRPASTAIPPAHVGLDRPEPYQQYLCERFGDIIRLPAFEYVSKTPETWLLVGDRRKEIAARIDCVIERYGLGIGMLVLHLQQLRAGHIITSTRGPGSARDLAVPPETAAGADGSCILHIPLRQIRADFSRLAALNICKPFSAWNQERIVTHERDGIPCAYCSCSEIHPAEVVVNLDGGRHGLSRNYSLGFTFAPFGNPLTAIHFLAWDRAAEPLNMNRVPMTVSDLVKLTCMINDSIRTFFADAGIRHIPRLDGVSNGWAGNSIFHQHFQFFVPHLPLPVTRAVPAAAPLVRRDDVTVTRLDWPAPVYRIRADAPLNCGLVGNDLAGIWRLLGGSRRMPYKTFPDGHVPTEQELVPAHTQNVHVPGADRGCSVHMFLRDRERVDFLPGEDEVLRPESGLRARPKRNLGVLEAAGMAIFDDPEMFAEMRKWAPEDVSRQIQVMIGSLSPGSNKIQEFESAIGELFPA